MATVNAFSEQNINFKTFKIIYQMLHILSGLDFGFFEPSQRVFWNSVTLILSVIMACVCMQMAKNKESLFIAVWIYLSLIHYISTVLCLILIKPSKKFAKLFNDLETIDFELKLKSELNLEVKILFVILLHFVFRIPATFIMLVVTGDQTLDPVVCGSLMLWLLSCLFLIHISFASVFYSVNYRLKELDVVLRKANSGFSSLQHTYKSIVDLTEAYKTAFDPVFLTSLLISIPEVMFTIYYAVVQLRSGFGYMRMEYFIVMESLLIMFAPAICAGQLATQTDKIIYTLHEKLMEDMDEEKVVEIERFIRYVDARGCRFRVYKVIPLDADLLGMVLSFCATYLIVIIQFTN